jgi:hypothetical protein
MNNERLASRIDSFRPALEPAIVSSDLGLLGALSGTWEGEGFNLIARPNFHDKANLYLQLNTTREHLKIEPIGSPIPNRGLGQDDITLNGLGYLQKIQDAATGGALHFEPGLWVTQPSTSYPNETAPPHQQIVFRSGSIPHGNSLLAQGVAAPFSGPPVIKSGTTEYAFAIFPSFNSTPFPTTPPAPPPVTLNAAGSSEKLTAAAAGVPPFQEYDLTVPASLANPRSPFGTSDPALPDPLNGIPLQQVINDPILLLQEVIKKQIAHGHSFEGTVINIATQKTIRFFNSANSAPTGAFTDVAVTDGAGGIENILFLEGGEPSGPQGPNAQTALVYATFWIEKVSHPHRATFFQLQYAQTVILNFPIFTLLNPTPPAPPKLVNIGWPHVSVATLRKSFG